MPTFPLDAGRSTLSLAASSSLHPINGVAAGVRGAVETAEDGRPTAMRLEIDVTSISSGNALYDRTLPRAVDARKFPTITAVSTAIEPAAGEHWTVHGEVTFHGRTTTATGDVAVVDDGGTLRLQGEQTFDVRDFGVTPPKLLGLKVHPDVTVHVDLHTTAPNP